MRTALCSLVAIVVMCGGCAATIPTLLDGGIAYPYGPKAFNIHPLSRLTGAQPSELSTLWLCVEFTDIDHQTTRATGTVLARIRVPGRPEIEQSFDLNDLTLNNELWDRPTRMYQLRFQIDPPLVDARRAAVGVEVRWTPVNAAPAEHLGEVRAPEPRASVPSAGHTSDRISP